MRISKSFNKGQQTLEPIGARLSSTREKTSWRGWRLTLTRLQTGWVRLLNISIILLGCRFSPDEGPSTAFFYGRPVPLELFTQYERVVVEVDSLESDKILKSSTAQIFVYLSVGEAERWRNGYEQLEKGWFLGVNSNWKSDIADLTEPGWQKYLLKRMSALWARGYRGFFLDTLDSYRAVVAPGSAQAAQREALLDLIREMHKCFPGIQLLFNRGFELLPEASGFAVGIVAESLFQSWDPVSRRYKAVNDADRAWLLEHLQVARDRYNLPVTVIDYLQPEHRALAHENAIRIAKLGFTPWITNPSLDIIGIGAVDLAVD
jgi:hypothetical protein